MRFGVQALAGETELQVAEAVLRKANQLKIMFPKLDLLEPIGIGTSRFYRVDAGSVDMSPVIEALFAAGRGVVSAGPDGKLLIRIGSRKGEVPSTTMQVSSKPPTTFRGTSDPYWDRQFG